MSVRSSNVWSSQKDRENRTISTLEFHHQTIVNYCKDRSFFHRIKIVKTNDRAELGSF